MLGVVEHHDEWVLTSKSRTNLLQQIFVALIFVPNLERSRLGT